MATKPKPKPKIQSPVWTKQQWQTWENVGLAPTMELRDLDLRWTDPKIRGVDIIGATSAINLERTIEGPSTLTINIKSPFQSIFSRAAGRYTPPTLTASQRRAAAAKRDIGPVDEGWEPIVRPELQGQPCEVGLQGAKFRLVKVGFDYADDSAVLTFEDIIIYLLKRIVGERRASRDKLTRAQFVLSQLREVKSIKPPFICPELLVKQPIDKGTPSPSAKLTSATTTSGGSGGGGGFSPNAKLYGMDGNGQRYEIAGDKRRNAETVLRAADKITGDPRARVALVEACNIENTWSNSSVHNDADSEGILQVRVGIHGANATNIEWCVGRFLNGPSWTGAQGGKGAIALAKAFPSWSEGKIAQTIQGSAFPSRYDKSKPAAVDLLRQWGGAGGTSEGTASSSYDVEYNVAYQFAREKEESAYASVMRLASEVNWRFFPVGEVVYYMSEEQLFNRRIRYTWRPGDPGIINLKYDVDWGKPVSECVVTIALSRWGAPPGSVIELEGWEVPDGRWLVKSINRDWFKPIAEVTLIQPGKALMEPAAEKASKTITTPGTQSGIDIAGAGDLVQRIWAAAQEATNRNWKYSQPLRNRQDSGYADCSSGVSWVLNKAGVPLPGPMTPNAPVSGMFESWGQAGPGEHVTIMCNGGHIWMKFTGLGAWRFDTGGGSGGRCWPTARSTGGFVQRHWQGT